MNILFITERVLVEGGAQVIPKTPLAYAKRGHKVFYISCSLEIPEHLKGEIKGYLHENITYYGLSLPFRKLFVIMNRYIPVLPKVLFLFLFVIFTCKKAEEIFRNNRIDVIYGYEIYGVIAAHIFNLGKGLPIVSRYQGTKLYPYLNSKWRKLLLWDHIIALKLPGDLTIMTDDGTRGDIVLKRLGSPVKILRFWRNGVDPYEKISEYEIELLKKKLKIRKEEKVLLTVSRLVRWKGVDRAIKALPFVLKEFPNTKLVIVGDGPFKKELKKLVKKLGLENNVIFVGNVPHSEVKKYLMIADVFLSLYDISNLGNPLLEALRYGKCIITLNNGTTGEVIRNFENGILLDVPEDILLDVPEDLIYNIAQSIIKVLRDDELRARLALNAYKYAEENLWTWEERMEAEVSEVVRLVEQHKRG